MAKAAWTQRPRPWAMWKAEKKKKLITSERKEIALHAEL